MSGVEIKVPDIGDFKEVEIIDVMVADGDTVGVDDALVTLETDKAAMDVPSPEAGVIKQMKVKVGDKVSEGSVIAIIEAATAAESKPEPTRGSGPAVAKAAATESDSDARRSGPTAAKAEVAKPESGRVQRDAPTFANAHASPSVRKFARELGVELTRVPGTGRKGRITHDDVKGFVKGVMAGGGSGGGFALPQAPAVDFAKWGPVETSPLPRIKRISGPHLQRAWITIPHVTQHDEADITNLETVRKALKGDAEKVGAKLTPLAFIIKACVHALKEYPDFNASLDSSGQNLVHKHYWHIGFAVDTPEGLVVPVIRDADSKSVFDIAGDLGDISARARERKLKADEMQGGTFSVSSLGGIGGTAFTPIINAPEVAILGVSRAFMKPVWDGQQFQPRQMLPLSLSYDHRVIDGAAAARFTTYLGEVLGEVRNLVL